MLLVILTFILPQLIYSSSIVWVYFNHANKMIDLAVFKEND